TTASYDVTSPTRAAENTSTIASPGRPARSAAAIRLAISPVDPCLLAALTRIFKTIPHLGGFSYPSPAGLQATTPGSRCRRPGDVGLADPDRPSAGYGRVVR